MVPSSNVAMSMAVIFGLGILWIIFNKKVVKNSLPSCFCAIHLVVRRKKQKNVLRMFWIFLRLQV